MGRDVPGHAVTRAATRDTAVARTRSGTPAQAVMVFPERSPVWGVPERQQGQYGLRYEDRHVVTFEVSTRQKAGGVVCIAVSGELDMATADQVIDAVTAAADADGVTAVQVDVAALAFLDSAGIGALIKTKRLTDDRGTAYRVINAGGQPRRVLELTGVLAALTAPGPAPDAS